MKQWLVCVREVDGWGKGGLNRSTFRSRTNSTRTRGDRGYPCLTPLSWLYRYGVFPPHQWRVTGVVVEELEASN